MWVPVYKKGEGPSSLPPKSPKKVELKVPPGYLKRYEEEHKGTKNGTKTVGVCRICKQKFDYIKSRRSMARKLCSVICAYQAQKKYNREYNKRCSDAKKLELRKKLAEEKAKKKETNYNSRLGDNPESQKTFVERVAEHLPPKIPLPKVVETTQPARPVSQPPSWETLVEEAGNMGIELDKEPTRAQNFYIALLMARRAHHHEEWKKLLKSQNVRIRQLPETYMALKSVSGEGAIGAARALKTRMGM